MNNLMLGGSHITPFKVGFVPVGSFILTTHTSSTQVITIIIIITGYLGYLIFQGRNFSSSIDLFFLPSLKTVKMSCSHEKLTLVSSTIKDFPAGLVPYDL